MLKSLLSIVLLLTAATSGLMALVSNSDFIDHTVENSKTMLADFERVANSRSTPSTATRYQIDIGRMPNVPCEDAKFVRAREKAGDKELLVGWRGEWSECYSPRSKTHTLILDRNGYSLSGRLIADQIGFSILCVLSAIAAVYVFKTRNAPFLKRATKPQPAP